MLKMSLSLLGLGLVLSAFACKQESASPVPPEPPKNAVAEVKAPASSQPSSQPKDAGAQAEQTWADGPVHRGEPFTVAEETALSALLAKPKDYEGKAVKVSGKVTKACAKKGCWMELRSSPDEVGARITFKDYGFFVPLDSAGATATVEGQVKISKLDKDTVEHLKGEGAQVVEDEKGEAVEIGLVASAVELEKSTETN